MNINVLATVICATNPYIDGDYLGINSSHCGIEDFIEKISGLSDVKKILVYGTEDDDFNTDVPTLRALACDSLEIILVDGADHHFTGRVDDFIALVDLI